MKNKLRKIKNIFKEFGITFSIKYLYYKAFHKDEKYIELVYKVLFKDISPLIDKYKGISEEKGTIEKNVPIWVCWWQGYENMPQLCKMLFNRIKQMAPNNSDVVLITLDNYLEYAQIPNLLVEKFENGNISMTTFSDILRNYLIRDNGGLWIDTSVFVSKNISENFLKSDKWWSVKLYDKNATICNLGQKISERRWSGFLQKGAKGNILNSFVSEAFLIYFKKHDIIVDYFIQNLFIKIAYNNIPSIKNIIDGIPSNNINVYSLYDNIDEEFNEISYSEWNSNTSFYKLTQKREYNINTENGKMTYFGAIKKICEEGAKEYYG